MATTNPWWIGSALSSAALRFTPHHAEPPPPSANQLRMIDYHEQHAYAYELFGLPRNDESEIGPMRAGRGRQARESYTDGIANVLVNCQKVMTEDCDIFMVANDKFNLYPTIAERSGLSIYREYKRPVLNRSEGDKGAYAETIFHMKRV